MPNTKSAEKRVRSSEKKFLHNNAIRSRLKTLEKRFLDAVKEENADKSKTAYNNAASALDKAAKVGVIHKSKADRKKSRLSAKVNALKAPEA